MPKNVKVRIDVLSNVIAIFVIIVIVIIELAKILRKNVLEKLNKKIHDVVLTILLHIFFVSLKRKNSERVAFPIPVYFIVDVSLVVTALTFVVTNQATETTPALSVVNTSADSQSLVGDRGKGFSKDARPEGLHFAEDMCVRYGLGCT